MKTILLLLLAMCFRPAEAGTVECPKSAQGKPLTGVGAFFDKQTEIQGVRHDSKGGYRIELPLNVAWLVCEYGPPGASSADDQRWIEVRPPEKVKRCDLRVREAKRRPVEAKLACD